MRHLAGAGLGHPSTSYIENENLLASSGELLKGFVFPKQPKQTANASQHAPDISKHIKNAETCLHETCLKSGLLSPWGVV